jgi:hypothetical protein
MDITESRPWVIAARTARQQSIEQVKMVMRYRDLAEKLCQPPIGYAKPEQWNGYVPPAYDPEHIDGSIPLNDSPRRTALLALLEEAAERADAEMGRAA